MNPNEEGIVVPVPKCSGCGRPLEIADEFVDFESKHQQTGLRVKLRASWCHNPVCSVSAFSDVLNTKVVVLKRWYEQK